MPTVCQKGLASFQTSPLRMVPIEPLQENMLVPYVAGISGLHLHLLSGNCISCHFYTYIQKQKESFLNNDFFFFNRHNLN